eukprot:TRINITY_DN15367_c0_g1_i1.p1 TRINITY_DN15367_c0_g1~~TRINITY_DN15367_c0_g1_i1.p1  ORF type:complete len:647 (-),score=60.64 TRINITY_DN15367_c0_g1_i1:81-1904(-)
MTNPRQVVNVRDRVYFLPAPQRPPLKPCIGVPEFYPVSDNPAPPECRVDTRTIIEGFVEPGIKEPSQKWDESCTARLSFNASNIPSLKLSLAQASRDIEWKKLVRPKPPEAGPPKKRLKMPSVVTMQAVGWIEHQLGSSKPLQSFQQVPRTQKGENLLEQFIKFRIPLLSASWFFKVVVLHEIETSKKTSQSQSTLYWAEFFAGYMVKACKDRAPKGLDAFEYVARLMRWMYHEGLLGQEAMLQKLLELTKSSDASRESALRPQALSLYCSLLMEYLDDMCQLPRANVLQLLEFLLDRIEQLAPSAAAEAAAGVASAPTSYTRLVTCLRTMACFTAFEVPQVVPQLSRPAKVAALLGLLRTERSDATADDAAAPLPAADPDASAPVSSRSYQLAQQQHDRQQQQLVDALWQRARMQIDHVRQPQDSFRRAVATEPDVAEPVQELDAQFSRVPLSEAFSRLFQPVPPASQLSAAVPPSTAATVDTICEWVVSDKRHGSLPCDQYRVAVGLALLGRAASSLPSAARSPPLQPVLTRFLESFNPRSATGMDQCCPRVLSACLPIQRSSDIFASGMIQSRNTGFFSAGRECLQPNLPAMHRHRPRHRAYDC